MKYLLLILATVILAFLGYYVFVKWNYVDLGQNSFNTPQVNNTSNSNFSNVAAEQQVYVSPISIDFLRVQTYGANRVTIEQTLSSGSNYKRYIASYTSEGYKIYGLLTVPNTEPPQGGFSAIVFNHGYIPPEQYRTTEKYIEYVDTLARNGFVVFKIDLRGHGDSEGFPTGSYFSSGYTIDALNALQALQSYPQVNPEKIGMWGHSMAGNLVLRAMLVSDEIKAGVIWAGAVYSYKDYGEYRLNDNSYTGQRQPGPDDPVSNANRETSSEIQKLRQSPDEVDFSSEFWQSISLTQNLKYLTAPIQLHHSVNDSVVNIGYSRDLKTEAELAGKDIEVFEYTGGGHNITSPYFEQAMQRTVEFFKKNL